MPLSVYSSVTGVALAGTLCGQLFFGYLGDKIGRKKAYGMTLLLMIFSSIASGLSFNRHAGGVIATLCFFRFWLGFGIGGDYPLSATIMSEYANKKTRGAFISAVFAMQGFGILFAGIISLIISAYFKNRYKAPPYEEDHIGSTLPESDYVWRIILMFGAIPATLTFYWRIKMPETPRYTALVAHNATRAAEDMARVLNMDFDTESSSMQEMPNESNNFGMFSKEFYKRHFWNLMGTCSTWFLFDIAFYSQNLFQKDVFASVGWIESPEKYNAIEEVYIIARAQTLIALCGTLPGYWMTVGLIDVIGRRNIQLLGFLFMTIFMLAISIPYTYWKQHNHRNGFLVMYGLTFFFATFGPNATTFVVPVEIFPSRLRSTCHGISAAAGKAGAILGNYGFLYLPLDKMDDDWKSNRVQRYLFILAGVNILGFFFTFLLPESKGKTLEEASQEN